MRIILIIFISFYPFIATAQLPSKPYEKVKLKVLQPIWYETAYHPDLVSDLCDGYNYFEYCNNCDKIFDGENVYMILGTIQSGSNWGAYIEKRNMGTGELLWRTKYHKNDLQYQEVLKKWYLNDHDELVVFGLRKYKTPLEDNSLFCIYEDTARVTYRVYDTKDGHLKEYINPPNSDTLAANVVASININLPTPNIFRTNDPDVYRYTQSRTREADGTFIPNHQLRTFYMDKYGHHLSPEDTIVLGEQQVFHNLKQLSPDTLIYLEQDILTGQKLKIHFLDIDLNKLKTIELDSLPFLRGLVFLFKAKKDQFFVLDYSSYPGPDIRELLTLMLYDDKGKLVDYYRYDNLNDGYLFTMVDYLEKRKKLIFAGAKWLGDHSDFYIITSDGKGGKDTLVTIQPTDLSRSILPQTIHELDNDKIMVTWLEGLLIKDNFQTKFDRNARAVSTLLFHAADLGLSTVGTEEASRYKEMNIMPNPVRDKFQIQLDDILDGDIGLYDNLGKRVLHRLVSDESTVDIDVSTLPSGVYYIKLKSKLSKEVYNTKKIIKM